MSVQGPDETAQPTEPQKALPEQQGKQEEVAARTEQAAGAIGGKAHGWSPKRLDIHIPKPSSRLPTAGTAPAERDEQASVEAEVSSTKQEALYHTIEEEMGELSDQAATVMGSDRREPRAYTLVANTLTSVPLKGANLEETKECAQTFIQKGTDLLEKIITLEDTQAQRELFTRCTSMSKDLATCPWIQALDKAFPEDTDLRVCLDRFFSTLCNAELLISPDTANQDLFGIIEEIPRQSTIADSLRSVLATHKEQLEKPLRTYTKIACLEKRLNALGTEHKLVTTTVKIRGERREFTRRVKRNALGRFFSRTGLSRGAHVTALNQLKTIHRLHGELEELKRESPEETTEHEMRLKNAFLGLTKSEWFQGTVRHHSQLTKPLLTLAKILLPEPSPETLGEWVSLANALPGTYALHGVKDLIGQSTSAWSNEQWSKELSRLDRSYEQAIETQSPAKLSQVITSFAYLKKSFAHFSPENETKSHALQQKIQESVPVISEKIISQLSSGSFTWIYEAQTYLDLLSPLVDNNQKEFLALQRECVHARTEHIASSLEMLSSCDDTQTAAIDAIVQLFSKLLTQMSETERIAAHSQVTTNSALNDEVKKELLDAFTQENYRRILQCAIRPDSLQIELLREELSVKGQLHTSPELVDLFKKNPKLRDATAQLLQFLKTPLDIDQESLLSKFEPFPELHEMATELLNMSPEEAKRTHQLRNTMELLIGSYDTEQALRALADEALILLPLGKNRLFTIKTFIPLAASGASTEQIKRTKQFLFDLIYQWNSSPTPLSEEEKEACMEAARVMSDPTAKKEVLTALRAPPPKPPQILTGSQKADESTPETVSDDLFAQSVALFSSANLTELTTESAQKALKQMKDRSEKLSYLIATDILSSGKSRTVEAARERSLFWADVAVKSLQRGDIATSFAIYSALQKTYVDRLNYQKGTRLASKQYDTLLQELKGAFDPSDNFVNVRTLMKEKKNCIPHIAFYLPLVEQSSAKSFPETGALPTRLLDMHYRCISPLRTLQKQAFPHGLSAQTNINALVEKFHVPEKEEPLYSLSQEILPRA